MSKLHEIQVAGLLHDIGKFVRKYNKGKGAHEVLSGEFIESNKELCLGYDADTIIGLVASHHSGDSKRYNNSVGSNIEPDKIIDATLANKVYTSASKVDSELLKILTMADSLSASSDRRSETGDGTSGHSEYAPLWSPIAQVFGTRLAVKSGSKYRVYEYTGTDDTKDTVTYELNDSKFSDNMLDSYSRIKNSLSELTDIEDLLNLLEKCWSTVNVNTWRPAGSSLGNTTTSLFDHSKTTSAIAGCLMVNKMNNVKFSLDNPNIDIWHITYVGNKASIKNIIKDELNKIGLSTACIIGNTGNEVYFLCSTLYVGIK